jgi:ADP-ribose pyrophosphatase YjhB (NUDIX family)
MAPDIVAPSAVHGGDAGRMSSTMVPRWLEWAREIQALAQTTNHFSENEYQRERCRRLLEIASEIVSEHADLPLAPLTSTFRAQIGYATPRIDVRGAVFSDGKLLLVQETLDGGWTMPGGWADVGNVPSEAAEREVFEESGFRVRARKVIGVYDANRTGPLAVFHAFKLVFLCQLQGGAPTPSAETTAVAFFGLHEIPALLSGERTRSRHITDAFAAFADSSLPTVFD